jgi:programmed cell death protein 5
MDGNMPGGMGGAPTGAGVEEEQKRSQMEEMRQSMLTQILDNTARERLNRISIVKPDRARAIEDLIIRMARTGQLGGKLNEKGIIDLLEQIRSSEEESQPKIIINRRRFDDSDDDEYDFS